MGIESPSPTASAEPPALGWILYLAGLAAYWTLPRLFFPLVLFLVVVGSASWVLFDAHQVQAQRRPIGSPAGWSILTLLFWVLVLPIYLLKRRRIYTPTAKSEMTKPLKATLIMLGVAFLLLAVLWWFALGRDKYGASSPQPAYQDLPTQGSSESAPPQEHLTPNEQVIRAMERAKSRH